MVKNTGMCSKGRGFTLIELLVVLAILALLLTLAVPRYFHSVDASREAVLKENLHRVRDTLDKFRGDIGRYPESLAELVEKGYLRALPMDPMTESAGTWEVIAPPDGSEGAVYDIRSGAVGAGREGRPYREW
ncbi:prepilin-type N-terminal cleavage/methylation domain-containing protein [Methylibium rhizosphaerae]|uniref:prepilin-type N-terminal cleavage/methylation domain-containing protein n=1 Tax=Methylibium rhizosphaerae TaxID=2570323 RepID=UPI0011293C32|nr:prepilin-type N-terminal cleavage/methylation domain-containing protein [Methylibium rhizosphaerae]